MSSAGQQDAGPGSFLKISPKSSRVQPGAVLLSPKPKAASGMESTIKSPLLNSSLGATRPLSVQEMPVHGDFLNYSNATGGVPDNARPFSANTGAKEGNNGSNNSTGTSGNDGYTGFNIPERPLSSMEVDSFTFKQDLDRFDKWICSLNSNQQRTFIDNLLTTLPDEILHYTKSKLNQISFSEDAAGAGGAGGSKIIHPTPTYQEPLTLDSVLNDTTASTSNWLSPQPTRTLSPFDNVFNNNSETFQTFGSDFVSLNRPRSADPYAYPQFQPLPQFSQQQGQQQYHQDEYSQRHHQQQPQYHHNRSLMNNLAQQLAPSNTNASLNANGSPGTGAGAAGTGSGSTNNLDFKLSALSTINSRAQFDSKKTKKPVNAQQGQQQPFLNPGDERGRNYQPFSSFNYYENESQIRNSLSVPPPQRSKHYNHHGSDLGGTTGPAGGPAGAATPSISSVLSNSEQSGLNKLASLNSATKNLSLEDTPVKHGTTTAGAGPAGAAAATGSPKSPAINPKQLTNINLLNDIPMWLKTLRLHKYTVALQDTPWKELIYLDDKQLEQKGVTAMGARGKLLKAFDVVKQYYENGEIKEN